MLAWIFLFVVLAVVGKLVYDVQKKKNKPTQTEDGFDKEAFQKLAGIIPTDPTMNVRTSKIYTIDKNFGDSDPLASVPMSRVSKEAKQKMAEIAKEDIKINTEAITKDIIDKGLYTIPTEVAPVKPKRKYTKRKPKA